LIRSGLDVESLEVFDQGLAVTDGTLLRQRSHDRFDKAPIHLDQQLATPAAVGRVTGPRLGGRGMRSWNAAGHDS
jgi:hypothetical protein